MKICLIAPIPPFRGGIAKYCLSLAQELEKRHDLLLLSYRQQYPELLYAGKSQIDPGVDRELIQKEFRKLSYDIVSANPVSWQRTAATISTFRADAVILPWWIAYWTPMYLFLLHALRKKGIKVIFLCINVYGHECTALNRFLTRAVLGRVDNIIVHSEQELREVQECNPTAVVRKHFLPLFSYPAEPRRTVDEQLHLLFFGFVRPYKGLDILLEAVNSLKARNIYLKVAGEFWNDVKECHELVSRFAIADKVEIIDRYVSDDEMSEYFAWADLVVLPYRSSRTSGVIATAYGYGKPVLVTDVGGFGEVVIEGYTGKIVAPGDPQALVKGIEWFLDNREIDFAANIAEFAARTMSWSSLVDVIDALCRNED